MPSDQPSLLPSDKPSSVPSNDPSLLPSAEPNTLPTWFPTQEPSSKPSKSDSKEFLLCPEEKSATGPSNHSLFSAFSNTTVGDVKSAVEHLLFALTNGTFIATLASNNTGVDIALSSIALSQPLDFQSEHFNTQIEVQGALQTLVEAIDDVDEVRIGAFDTLTSSLAGGRLLDFLVNVTDRIVIVKEDYVNFLDSRSNETKATREHFTDKFRYVRTSMWGAILQICLFCLSQSSSC
jgi:hypothetical protein